MSIKDLVKSTANLEIKVKELNTAFEKMKKGEVSDLHNLINKLGDSIRHVEYQAKYIKEDLEEII